MFARQATDRSLGLACRSLATMLHAGLSIIKAFELISNRGSDFRMRRAMLNVVSDLKSGADVTDALRNAGDYFPSLFIDTIHVAEQSGNMPEVLKALSEHYENNVKLRKDFLGQITLPVIQLVAAVFIIAGMIFLMGIVGAGGGQKIDPLGFGLVGADGALHWLGGWAAATCALVIAYKLLVTSLSGQQQLHTVLLKVPVLGHCLRSFAIARFSWSFALTQESGLPIEDSLNASMRATGNGAFIAAAQPMIEHVMEGSTLTEAILLTGLFPDDYAAIVNVAETSGTVPEALHRLSPEFEEEARRSLHALTTALGWLIKAIVAGFIILIIFRIMSWYIGLINSGVQDAMNPH